MQNISIYKVLSAFQLIAIAHAAVKALLALEKVDAKRNSKRKR